MTFFFVEVDSAAVLDLEIIVLKFKAKLAAAVAAAAVWACKTVDPEEIIMARRTVMEVVNIFTFKNVHFAMG